MDLVALISAIAALVGVFVSFFVARARIRTEVMLKTQELDAQVDFKAQEIETQIKTGVDRLRAELEAAKQQQLTEIVKKRIETYPALYKIISIPGWRHL